MLTFKPVVQLHDLHPSVDDFKTAVVQGLTQPQKMIPPRFLYDKSGSELFEAICTLEEYYLTRTETMILRDNASEMAALMGEVLIEFGSGSSQKARILLDASPQVKTYVALDISRQHLYESCTDLMQVYQSLEVIAICTDYMQGLQLSAIPTLQSKRKMGFFPGSSIGNLEPEEAVRFLQRVADVLDTGALLIGVDLKKSKEILEPAYDDAPGISAAFALNLLTRMNCELGTDFNLSHFSYRAFYNPIGRVEMEIVSLEQQVIHLGEIDILFRQGETLRTEYSYKYTIAEFQAIATQAGLQPQAVWTDP